MKLEKLFRICSWLMASGITLHSGMVLAGQELRLAFSSQLPKEAHDYLLRKGFVEVDSEYIYRP